MFLFSIIIHRILVYFVNILTILLNTWILRFSEEQIRSAARQGILLRNELQPGVIERDDAQNSLANR